ncbi:MAG: PD-(D/E)XK nuclease family protein [Clostridia bacterium]|nr:PD-(D/E)XK nuclease family protein [Clostridia bacterium]
MTAVYKAYTLSECLDTVVALVEKYERAGEYNLIFCEDRLTLVAERAIARRLGGSFLTSVSTFSRFLKTDSKILGKQGSVMAVGKTTLRLQRENKLQCFTSPSAVAKDAKCIYETLAQFSASGIEPETLKENAALLNGDILKTKIEDIALIYEGYSEFLKENGYIDESKYLSLLPDRIRAEKRLKGANIFFLCYTAFTAQAAQTIRAACEVAGRAIGVFCGGEEEFYTNSAADTFARVAGEYETPRIYNAGIPLEGEAEVLRAGLFDPEKLGGQKYPTDKIRIFEGEDKTDEAETVAANIRELVAENEGMRYRDIAVLLPDAKKYALPLKKAFAEYDIPYFFDEKISLKRHPLSRFLLDCFDLVKENFSPRAVQSLTGNYFFGESGEYRNYLLKYANYRGGAKKPIKTDETVSGYDTAALESGRARLMKIAEKIKRRGQGREYCLITRDLLREFNTENKLSELEANVSDPALKGYLAQVLDGIEKTLAEAEKLVAGEELTAGDFRAILEDGLGATEISLIPLKSDAVFVGDIIDSRIEKVRALFAVGMTDETPRSGKDTALVSDKDIGKLAEVKTKLEPTVAEVNLRGRENFCLNLCTFTDRLFLSYPLSASGDEPALSEVFRYVRGLFSDNNGGVLLAEKNGGAFRYKCSAITPALRQLLLKKSEFERGEKDTREEYSALYEALKRKGMETGEDLLRRREASPTIERGEALFFKDGKISPTALEGYFSCPFKNFAARGLKLKERDETAVMAFDSGNFIHELLEETSKHVEEFQTEEELRAYAKKIGGEIAQRATYAAQRDTGAGAYAAEKLLEEGVEAAAAVYRQIKGSDFKVEEVEKAIETDEITGKVDRVDGSREFVRIVDYKTGAIDDSPTSYYTGQKMQMQLYMSAVKGERVPAGVFYFPASMKYAESTEDRFRMKGFLNGDKAALLCGDKNLTEEKKSEFFSASLKNGGNAKKIMNEEQFVDFLDYAILEAKQGKQELKEGFIAPSPYEGNCEYCKFGGMCGFNRDLSQTRKESEITPAEIAGIVRRIKEGGEN